MNESVPPPEEPQPPGKSPLKVPPQVPGPEPDFPDPPGVIPNPAAPVEEPGSPRRPAYSSSFHERLKSQPEEKAATTQTLW